MGPEHGERLRKAAQAAEEAGLSALLVTPSPDLVYLTGYDPPPLERLTCLAIRPGAGPLLLVPELERPLADGQVGDGQLETASWGETEDPYAKIAAIVGSGSSRIAVSDRTWASHLIRLRAAISDLDAVPGSDVLGPLRAIKDAREVQHLERAARSADEVFRRVVEARLEGLSERDVADMLGRELVEAGHDRALFTIVASGPNAASPHHTPGERAIRAGDGVVMDFGGSVGGYCSDVSRTVAVGRPPARFEEIYEVVREAQERAVHAVRPGVPAEGVDVAARDVIRQAGFGAAFVHRTGHGIGLEEHEPPYIVPGNTEPLRPGMCFSVEPGIYLEGQFGVRIEDIVLVTDDGVARLNHAPRELLRLR